MSPIESDCIAVAIPDGVKTISVTMHLESEKWVREAAHERDADIYYLPYECAHAKWIGARYEVGDAEVTLLAPLGDH